MLQVRDSADKWCAVSAGVDGSLELRVAEPGSAWRRRQRRTGEDWLRDHGFHHVIDAWAMPAAAGTTGRTCAAVLKHALEQALAAPAGSDLVEALVHPGVIGSSAPPPGEASHADHIRFAIASLAAARRGKLAIEGGKPASAWAWVFVGDDELVLSPEDHEAEWTVPLTDAGVTTGTDRLIELLYIQLARDMSAPLFISFMPLKPSDPPLL